MDRRQFADSYETPDGRVLRRKRKTPRKTIEDGNGADGAEAVETGSTTDVRLARECPIPKPSGIVGRVMGFKNEERPKPAEVVVLKSLDGRRVNKASQEGEGSGP